MEILRPENGFFYLVAADQIRRSSHFETKEDPDVIPRGSLTPLYYTIASPIPLTKPGSRAETKIFCGLGTDVQNKKTVAELKPSFAQNCSACFFRASYAALRNLPAFPHNPNHGGRRLITLRFYFIFIPAEASFFPYGPVRLIKQRLKNIHNKATNRFIYFFFF